MSNSEEKIQTKDIRSSLILDAAMIAIGFKSSVGRHTPDVTLDQIRDVLIQANLPVPKKVLKSKLTNMEQQEGLVKKTYSDAWRLTDKGRATWSTERIKVANGIW